MEIYISGKLPTIDNDTGKSIRLEIPVMPESLKFTGAAKFSEYNILDSGSVLVPNGKEVGEYSWEGILPGKSRKHEPWVTGEWTAPKTIQTYFSVWRDRGVRLKLIATGTPINHYVYLSNYDMEYSGAYGDYKYSVTFKDARLIEVSSSKVSSGKPSATIVSPKRQEPEKSKTYTVRDDDTLWDISYDYNKSGKQWDKIYNANKSVIEAAAKKHGKSSSQNGKWIYAGTVLKIP